MGWERSKWDCLYSGTGGWFEGGLSFLVSVCHSLGYWTLFGGLSRSRSTLDQVMAWHLIGAKPLPEPMLIYCQLDTRNRLQWNLNKIKHFSVKKLLLKMLSAKCQPFCSGLHVLTFFVVLRDMIRSCEWAPCLESCGGGWGFCGSIHMIPEIFEKKCHYQYWYKNVAGWVTESKSTTSL